MKANMAVQCKHTQLHGTPAWFYQFTVTAVCESYQRTADRKSKSLPSPGLRLQMTGAFDDVKHSQIS